MSDRPDDLVARLREMIAAALDHIPMKPTDDERMRSMYVLALRDVLYMLDKLQEADALAATRWTAEIDCPLCGVTVKQVASATLSLALWQHVNWACAKRETAGTPDFVAQDAIKFFELILSECHGADAHSWRKCRRCLAIHELESYQPLPRGLVTKAIEALRLIAAPVPARPAETPPLCCCGQFGGCFHSQDQDEQCCACGGVRPAAEVARREPS